MVLLLFVACRTEPCVSCVENTCVDGQSPQFAEVNGTPVRVVIPTAPRYPCEAPIVVMVPGKREVPDATLVPQDEDLLLKQGFVVVSFLYPGECDGARCASGEWDQWGAQSVDALRRVVEWAATDLPDQIPIANPKNLGISTRSMGGAQATAALAQGPLPVQWLAMWEPPQNGQILENELRNHDTVNPYYQPGACTVEGCPVDWTTLEASPQPQTARNLLDPRQDYTFAYTLFFDANQNKALDDDEFRLRPWATIVNGKPLAVHSAVTMAEVKRRGLLLPDLVTPEQSRDFWELRDPSQGAWDAAVSAHPDLPVILAFSEENHVPNPPDAPQAQVAWQGWSHAGWLRFNPDAAYLPRDNELPANIPYSYDTLIHALVDESIHDASLRTAAILELADRHHHNRWEDDLESVLSQDTP